MNPPRDMRMKPKSRAQGLAILGVTVDRLVILVPPRMICYNQKQLQSNGISIIPRCSLISKYNTNYVAYAAKVRSHTKVKVAREQRGSCKKK